MSIDFTEFIKVMNYLIKNNIPCELNSLGGGYICSVPSKKEKGFDFVCSEWSYGHKDGLLEIIGDIVTDEELEIDSVVGWLTADNVIERIKKYQERKSGE